MRTWAAGVGGGAPRSTRDLSGGFSPGATTVLGLPRRRHLREGGRGRAEPRCRPSSTGARRWCRPRCRRRRSSRACSTSTTTATGWRWPSWPSTAGRRRIRGTGPSCRRRCARSMPCTTPSRPTPSPTRRAAAERLQPLFGGWAELAAMAEPPEGLDDWSARHLGRLAELESGWPDAVAGSTLLHWRRALRQPARHRRGVVFVDWPHACVGAPVFDLVAWAPSVELEGGPAPEELLALSVAGSAVDHDVVAPLVAAFGGFLVRHSLQPPPPGLPTLRRVPGRAGCGGAGLAPAPHGLVSPGAPSAVTPVGSAACASDCRSPTSPPTRPRVSSSTGWSPWRPRRRRPATTRSG